MSNRGSWIVVGLVAVVFVTLIATGAVVASAAITDEVTDGDACETRGGTDTLQTATLNDVASYAGTVTECIATGDDTQSSVGPPHDTPTRE